MRTFWSSSMVFCFSFIFSSVSWIVLVNSACRNRTLRQTFSPPLILYHSQWTPGVEMNPVLEGQQQYTPEARLSNPTTGIAHPCENKSPHTRRAILEGDCETGPWLAGRQLRCRGTVLVSMPCLNEVARSTYSGRFRIPCHTQ